MWPAKSPGLTSTPYPVNDIAIAVREHPIELIGSPYGIYNVSLYDPSYCLYSLYCFPDEAVYIWVYPSPSALVDEPDGFVFPWKSA